MMISPRMSAKERAKNLTQEEDLLPKNKKMKEDETDLSCVPDSYRNAVSLLILTNKKEP